MSRVVVTNHVTLDGVMQAPGRPDDDVRGGFDRGAWAVPDNDPVMHLLTAARTPQQAAPLLPPPRLASGTALISGSDPARRTSACQQREHDHGSQHCDVPAGLTGVGDESKRVGASVRPYRSPSQLRFPGYSANFPYVHT